jgi:hypothetical protein
MEKWSHQMHTVKIVRSGRPYTTCRGRTQGHFSSERTRTRLLSVRNTHFCCNGVPFVSKALIRAEASVMKSLWYINLVGGSRLMQFFTALWALAASIRSHRGSIPDSMISLVSLRVSSACRFGEKISSKQSTITNVIPDPPCIGRHS